MSRQDFELKDNTAEVDLITWTDACTQLHYLVLIIGTLHYLVLLYLTQHESKNDKPASYVRECEK